MRLACPAVSLRRMGKALGEWSNIHPILRDGHEVVVGSLMRVGGPSEVVIADFLDIDEGIHVIHVYSSNLNKPSEDITKPVYVPKQLTHINDALLAQLDLPAMESFWFTAADKTKLQGFLIRPPGFDAAKKYPLKFLIHGGPQGAWGDDMELSLERGVVCRERLRGGDDQSARLDGIRAGVCGGVNGDWGGKPFTDLMEGLDYAEQHYPFIDKNRECALGASYGGYMANWVLGHTDRFKCIVSHDGMFNPESAYGTTEELWFNEWELNFQTRAAVGLLRQAGRGESLSQVVSVAVGEKLQDADAGGSWAARLPAGCDRRVPAV